MLKRTEADKQAAAVAGHALAALMAEAKASTREVAKIARVSHQTVHFARRGEARALTAAWVLKAAAEAFKASGRIGDAASYERKAALCAACNGSGLSLYVRKQRA
jgi:hypothetical protein